MLVNPRRFSFCLGAGCLILAGVCAQTKVDLGRQGAKPDFSQASATRPNKTGTVLPAQCASGETFFKTDAAAGRNLFGCTAANTWTLLTQGGFPAGHRQIHQHNGGDEVARETPAPFEIPKAGSDGRLSINWLATGNADGSKYLRDDGTLQVPTVSALQGNPLAPGAPGANGQFYGWSPAEGRLQLFSWGNLLNVTGLTVNVASEVVPRYGVSSTIPATCGDYGLLHFDPLGAAGGKMLYCNGSAYERIGAGAAGPAGLSDPGSNGLVKRTAANTTTAAVTGVDYYAPGGAIAAADLPNPTLASGGKVLAKTCAAGSFVAAIGTDASVTCASAPAGGSVTVRDQLTSSAEGIDVDLTDPAVIALDEEWLGAAAPSGNLGWSMGAIGTSTATYARESTWPNLGTVKVTTGSTVAGNGNAMTLSGGDTLGALLSNADKTWKMTWVFRVAQAANQRFYAGVALNASSIPTNGIGVRHDTNAGALCGADTTTFKFWSFNTIGSNACYDTGVAVDTSYHTLRLRSDGAAAGKAWVQLDGGIERSVCPAGCDFTATLTGIYAIPYIGIATDEAATKAFAVDKWAFKARVSSIAGKRN